ncbi:MAG TPA: hypothetical protein VFG27_05095 [Pseudomonadales bacterium]|nr:hypothetical protein [Pseudomonadales bacterium]
MALGLALLAAACAGKDFTRPAPDTLVLGKTTYAEINGRYGSPYREGRLMKNEKNVRQAFTASGER